MRPPFSILFFVALLGPAAVPACGGKVEVDEPSTSGAGSGATGSGNAGTGASGASGGTGASGASGGFGNGPAGCSSHEQCGPDGVCLFAIGQCAAGCEPVDICEDCGPGTICDGCATTSCPKCNDCVPACVPIEPGQCDTNDACDAGTSCYWPAGTCQPPCAPGGQCPPGFGCAGCATGSCCGCDDCVDMCLEVDGSSP